MIFGLIDQALNVVMTGIVYGSEMWIACAFGLYVATQDPVVQKDVHEAKTQAKQKLADGSAGTPQPKPAHKINQKIKPRRAKPTVVVGFEPVRSVSTQVTREPNGCESIACEPVNWKQWKVADLRRASIAQVCGVRIRPIGSPRHLPKSDLIAQYEQQLRRLTKTPPEKTGKENIA